MLLLCKLVLIAGLTFSHLASGASEIALEMVPKGKVVEDYGRVFTIKTPAGTKIDIDFGLDGKFDEAKGFNLNRGDELEPGDGLMSLSSAARIVTKLGVGPSGYWFLEKDPELGWIYEFQNKTIINAKTGTIIKSSSLAETQGDSL